MRSLLFSIITLGAANNSCRLFPRKDINRLVALLLNKRLVPGIRQQSFLEVTTNFFIGSLIWLLLVVGIIVYNITQLNNTSNYIDTFLNILPQYKEVLEPHTLGIRLRDFFAHPLKYAQTTWWLQAPIVPGIIWWVVVCIKEYIFPHTRLGQKVFEYLYSNRGRSEGVKFIQGMYHHANLPFNKGDAKTTKEYFNDAWLKFRQIDFVKGDNEIADAIEVVTKSALDNHEHSINKFIAKCVGNVDIRIWLGILYLLLGIIVFFFGGSFMETSIQYLHGNYTYAY